MIDRALSSQQLQVICALSSGASTTDAAADAGIHRNTISNWRRNDFVFQHALAHAQYDRALHFREKTEALADLAIDTLRDILTDPKASPSVRLKAATFILETAGAAPVPKKQVQLDIEKIHYLRTNVPEPVPQAQDGAQSEPEPEIVHEVHKPAQQPFVRVGPKTGRNELCPCGSGQKFKRCCVHKPAQAQAA